MFLFCKVNCAKCDVRAKKPYYAFTMGGAIRKATIECEGIKYDRHGNPFPTECYRGELLDAMIDVLRQEEAA